MKTPGQWLVVARHVRDRHTKGEILHRCQTEEEAERIARSLDPNGNSKFNYFVTHVKNY